MRLWRDDGRDLPKNSPPEPLRLGRQTSTLIVVPPEAPVAQLLSEYSVFLPQVIDRVPLLLTHPSSDRNQQQPDRIEGRAHCDRIPAKTRVTAAANCRLKQIEFLDITGSGARW